MRVKRMLLWWLTKNATHVVHGTQAGGDRHLPIGWVEREVKQLLKGTSVRKRKHGSGKSDAYVIPIFDDSSGKTTEVPFRVMASNYKRADEVQLAAQTPGSATAIPVWEHHVTEHDTDRPKQLAAIALCQDGKFRAFVLAPADLKKLPKSSRELLERGRMANRATPLLLEATISVPEHLQPETERKESARQLAKELAAFENKLKGKRKQKVVKIRKWERNPRVRKLALRAYGPTCMIEGCRCTQSLSASQLLQVVDCHHIEAISSKGGDRLSNLMVLCPTHHMVFHRCDCTFQWTNEVRGVLSLTDTGTTFAVVRRRVTLPE